MVHLDTILEGDALALARELQDKSIDCIVTSPPYFGVRDYGVEGQLGAEDHPDEYIIALCDIFLGLYGKLRDTGSLWVNIGDCYVSNGERDNAEYHKRHPEKKMYHMTITRRVRSDVLPAKARVGVPYRFVVRMMACNWILRQSIIWAKEAAVPYTGKDRFRCGHEYFFHFVKDPSDYYFDQEPAMEERRVSWGEVERILPGDIWRVEPERDATHPAAYPEALVRPPILCSCPPGGVVLDPFMGSGTTAVVARKTGRKYIGFEINPQFIKIAEARLAPELF